MLTDRATIERIEAHQRDVIVGVEREVQERMQGMPPCHDWSHITRVRRIGAHLARVEGADTYVVDLALLLHDVGDHKFTDDKDAGVRIACEVLRRHRLNSSIIEMEVCEIIDTMSFSKGKSMRTLHGMVAQDADMLDAMGEVGIARAFSTGAHFGDPLVVTLEHFRKKLLLLKRRMNTKEGKRLAKRRHSSLSKFVHHFEKQLKLER